jgi:hypothetical protein
MASSRNAIPRAVILFVLVMLGISPSLFPAHGSLGWSSPILVETHAGTDILPSALQANNGTLWLAWQSNRFSQATGRPDILYKTYTNGVWSSDHNLTRSGWNSAPSLVQLSNGTILAFWVMKTGTSFLVFSGTTNGGSWSSPVQITSTSLNDTQPSAVVGRDGTIWLVWTRINTTCGTCNAIKQLFYKTWKAEVWSSEAQLTSDSNQNYGSTVVVSKDGLVRVTWSKGAAGGIYQLFTKTYSGGVWSSETQIVSSTSTDERPSMIQDRNGTLWLFWGRLVVVSLLVQYYEVVGKFSYDLGGTWSPEIILTSTSTTIDSFMPSAVQSNTGVKPLWVFYASNQSVPDYDIYAVTSAGVYPVHDVKISGLTASSNLGTNWEYPGGLKSVGQTAIVTVTVAVANIGDYVENAIVTLSATNTTITTIGTRTSLVGPGNTMNFYFYWNTTSVLPARYGLSVSIAALSGETPGNMGDNNYGLTNQIRVIPLGDIDQDGSVTLTDVSVFFYDYGFAPSCNCSRWNPYADIHGTGVIDIVDVGVVSRNYGILT